MKVYVFYGTSLDNDSLESMISFMADYARMKPEHKLDKHMIKYSGVSKESAAGMVDRLRGVSDIDVTCEKEPQDYEPLIFIEKNDKIRTSMAFKREANGTAVLSMQVTTSQVPIETIGEITTVLDNEKLKDMRRWVNEVME